MRWSTICLGGEEEEEEDDEAPDWDELEEDAVKSTSLPTSCPSPLVVSLCSNIVLSIGDSKQKLKRKERGDDYSSDEDERPKKKAKK